MTFTSEDSFAEHVKSVTLPLHAESMRGRRGGPGRRKAREVREAEADGLARIAWRNYAGTGTRQDAIQEMKENYGFVEWLFFGWQIINLIMQVVNILWPQVSE